MKIILYFYRKQKVGSWCEYGLVWVGYNCSEQWHNSTFGTEFYLLCLVEAGIDTLTGRLFYCLNYSKRVLLVFCTKRKQRLSVENGVIVTTNKCIKTNSGIFPRQAYGTVIKLLSSLSKIYFYW